MSAIAFEMPDFNKPDPVVKTATGELLLAPAAPTTPAVTASPVDVSDTTEAAEEALAELEANRVDRLPDFPRMGGSLSELAEALSPDIPYEFKMAAALTFWGLIRSKENTFAEEPHIQPRSYTCLIAPAWRGKTAAINEVRNAMSLVSANFSAVSSMDSGPALVEAFESQQEKTMVAGSSGSRLLLDPDELKDLFEKAKVSAQSRNSLFTEFLKLYEGNRTGNCTKSTGDKQIDYAHLAIIGGATVDGYPLMWAGTGGGGSGLQSRITIVGTNASKMPSIQRPKDEEAFRAAVGRLAAQSKRMAHFTRWTTETAKSFDDWWTSQDREKPSEARIPDIVKRLLLNLAETNDIDTITQPLLDQGIAFAEYEIQAREKYNPADSFSWVQDFENRIIQVLREKGIPMTQNIARRYVRPDRRPGGFGPFLQAWQNLIRAGVLKPSGNTQRTPKYSL